MVNVEVCVCVCLYAGVLIQIQIITAFFYRLRLKSLGKGMCAVFWICEHCLQSLYNIFDIMCVTAWWKLNEGMRVGTLLTACISMVNLEVRICLKCVVEEQRGDNTPFWICSSNPYRIFLQLCLSQYDGFKGMNACLSFFFFWGGGVFIDISSCHMCVLNG